MKFSLITGPLFELLLIICIIISGFITSYCLSDFKEYFDAHARIKQEEYQDALFFESVR